MHMLLCVPPSFPSAFSGPSGDGKPLLRWAEGVQLPEDEKYDTPELAEAFEGDCKDNIFQIDELRE